MCVVQVREREYMCVRVCRLCVCARAVHLYSLLILNWCINLYRYNNTTYMMYRCTVQVLSTQYCTANRYSMNVVCNIVLR